jgi:hypothetical protein
MKVVEVMGMEQARKWGVCTMNEFRQFVGLKRYESFKEWNPTGDIAVSVQSHPPHKTRSRYVLIFCWIYRKWRNSSISILTISNSM